VLMHTGMNLQVFPRNLMTNSSVRSTSGERLTAGVSRRDPERRASNDELLVTGSSSANSCRPAAERNPLSAPFKGLAVT
jgi:hypothetical protein